MIIGNNQGGVSLHSLAIFAIQLQLLGLLDCWILRIGPFYWVGEGADPGSGWAGVRVCGGGVARWLDGDGGRGVAVCVGE